MVIDSSAILAILFEEHDAAIYASAIEAETVRLMSASTAVEIGIVVLARQGPEGLLNWADLKDTVEIEIVPFTERHAELATHCFATYGKGRHRARLSFGDCCAYAAAIDLGEPLLFKGGDFHLTDVEIVPLPTDVPGLHEAD